MIRRRVLLISLLLNTFVASIGTIQGQVVRVSGSQDRAAEIRNANGQITTIPKERGQTGIIEAQIAPDGKSAGWLAEYTVEGMNYPFAGTLIVWREGKTIRRFQTGQSFYSWTFYAQGKQVAYHVGPLHGEQKSHCELRDVESGSLIAAWDGDLEVGANRPAWTKGLDH